MSSGHRTLTVFVTVICLLVLTIAGLAADWPRWFWPALGAVALTGTVAAARAGAYRGGRIPPETTLEPDLPIPPPPRQEHRVTNVPLPSAMPDYDFLFSATVRWIPEDCESPHFDPCGLAVHAVLLRAREFAARQSPRSPAMAQHQLNGVLSVMEPDASGRVLAMAKDVGLALSDSDRERLRKLSNVRKDEDVWEHERNYERNKRMYLSDDVLKDPGSAVVWWLARNDEQVEGTVERIGLLARLSAAANNSEVAPPFRDLLYAPEPEPEPEYEPEYEPEPEGGVPPEEYVAEQLMSWLGFDSDDPEMVHLAARMAEDVRATGRKDEAEKFLRFFGFPEDPPPYADGQPPGEDGPFADAG
ncbi:hypothetical protein DMB38_13355 [Streptomyces sp. WAC 06738]|uniref:hypothetical protein n=1 Tax=Streptomyces sp. WAC 06738 TaxID=2203210 RepID=UPI000F6CFC6E|nr:hypothetical protein [Streptomyces sp. WAC 06738]AZM46663.1 hypothetical protein DMB38_13355 [Streptomyces sp. WAC 06738]